MERGSEGSIAAQRMTQKLVAIERGTLRLFTKYNKMATNDIAINKVIITSYQNVFSQRLGVLGLQNGGEFLQPIQREKLLKITAVCAYLQKTCL